MRNVFEHAIRRLANRIAEVRKLTKEHLTVLEPVDIEFVGRAVLPSAPTASEPDDPLRRVLSELTTDGGTEDQTTQAASDEPANGLDELLANLDDGTRRFTVSCPSCGNTSHVPQTYLCRRVTCRKCKHGFTVEWGEVVDD